MMGVNVNLSLLPVNYICSAQNPLRWLGYILVKTLLIGVILMFSGTGTAQTIRGNLEIDESHPKLNKLNGDGVPIVRVNLLEGFEKVDFHLYGPFDIVSLSGETIFSNLKSALRWRARPEQAEPSKFIHHVLLKSFAAIRDAQALKDSLSSAGYDASVMEIGGIYQVNREIVIDSRKYRVVIGTFESEEECAPLIEAFKNSFNPRAVRRLTAPARGKVEFYDAEYDQTALVDNGFRLVPLTVSSKTLIRKVKVGTGFHWEAEEDRVYPGVVEIRLDHEGKLSAINEISIDQYLKGVVPSEMPKTYPLEALKAQAVAARSDALAKMGSRHLSDDYDLCATVHCQVYAGLTHRAVRTDSAVKLTAGEVLVSGNHICNAVYSSVCGGHTENKENVWNSSPESHLEGIPDSPNGSINTLDLSFEDDLRKWVDAEPPTFCNSSAYGSPPELNSSSKYFRWEETYNRPALEAIIKKKTGVDIGTFCGIEIIDRGLSGRIIEIEILGTITNHRIKSELSIRRALSETTLKSSCFYVTMTFDKDSIPNEITFHGAGWGHGVGMCQVGAAVMALQGYDYRAILNHYYRGTKVKKIYFLDNKAGDDKSILVNQEAEEE